jgi:hypothetical protein
MNKKAISESAALHHFQRRTVSSVSGEVHKMDA